MKKFFDIVRTVFTWLVVAITVVVMLFTIISVSTFDRNDRALFGFKAFIVLSNSMARPEGDTTTTPFFNAGDVVLVKEEDPSTFQEGDIICFTSTNSENYGETVTHKIRTVTTDEDGNPAFITYGINTDTDDETPVTFPYIKGKYVGKVPYAGTVFQFLKTTPGYICCILVPFLILIVMQAFNSIKLFRAYKKEQAEEIEAERAKLAAEREESLEMLKELQALKAQLAAMKGDTDNKPSEE